MGGGSSQQEEFMPKSPMVLKLRNTLCLQLQEKESFDQTLLSESVFFGTDGKSDLTRSLIYQAFSNQLTSTKDGLLSRKMNPFCVLEIDEGAKSQYESREWITCCMVSPMMAIASPIYICKQDHTFYRPCRIRGKNKEKDVFVEVQDIIHLDAHYVVLLILKEPLWELGWAGMSYLHNTTEIEKNAFKLVNHPERKLKEDDEVTFIQKVRTLYLKQTIEADFKVMNKDLVGSIICKVVGRKPYVVGVQISNINILFFSQEFFRRSQEKVRDYLTKQNRQQEFIKKIDLNTYEIQTQNW